MSPRRLGFVALVALLVNQPVVFADEADAETRAAVAAAAADLGCAVRDPFRDIKPLKAPHEGVYEVRCADALIIWFHRVDGAWTLKPLG